MMKLNVFNRNVEKMPTALLYIYINNIPKLSLSEICYSNSYSFSFNFYPLWN